MINTYLKTDKNIGLIVFVRINKENIVIVCDDSIKFEDNNHTPKKEKKWYEKEWMMKPTTKKEFDNFYIKTVNNLNKIINQ